MPRILAFGCHPDDIEFQCAGTLALLAQLGHEVHVAVMAGGEMGSPTLPPQQIREIRLQECAASAAVIGATFHYAGGYDIEVDYTAENRRRAIRVLREVDPHIVFTHPPMDYLIDHEETSRLVRNACFIAPIRNYDTGLPGTVTSGIPHLYYWNAMGLKDIFGRPLPLTCAVDVSTVMDTKAQMLSCHATQRDWLAAHHGMDQYLENMRQSTARQGLLIDRPAAEGFIQHLGDGYPQDNILAELLNDACVELPAGTNPPDHPCCCS